MALYNTVALAHENKSFIVGALPKSVKLDFRAIKHITGDILGCEKGKMTFVQQMSTLCQLLHSQASSARKPERHFLSHWHCHIERWNKTEANNIFKAENLS